MSNQQQQRGQKPVWKRESPFLTELLDLEGGQILATSCRDEKALAAAVDQWARLDKPVKDYIKYRMQMMTVVGLDMIRQRTDFNASQLRTISTGIRILVDDMEEAPDEELPRQRQQPQGEVLPQGPAPQDFAADTNPNAGGDVSQAELDEMGLPADSSQVDFSTTGKEEFMEGGGAAPAAPEGPAPSSEGVQTGPAG